MILAALVLSVAMSPAPPPAASLRTLPELPPQVVFAPAPGPTTVGAAAWGLYSVDGEQMLWENGADQQRAMASVTKVMTALLVAENTEATTAVAISANASNTPIGYADQPRVLEGDAWTVEELLANLLVQSGNDAAVALAEHVSGSLTDFVALMNERALQLGMAQTSFANPNGLDAPSHFTTARDLVKLGVAAIAEPRVTRTSRLKYVTFDPIQREEFGVRNSNRLLGSFPGIYGLKTGDTLNAGLVLLSHLDTGNHEFVGVVMAADDGLGFTALDHMVATTDLMGYALRSFRPSDYVLAPLVPADVTDALPDWLDARLLATSVLPTGRHQTTGFGTTTGERSVIAALSDLLPSVFGGAP